MTNISNPLSDKERLRITRLYDHDYVNLLQSMIDVFEVVGYNLKHKAFEELSSREKLIHKSVDWVFHTNYVGSAIYSLAQDEFPLESVDAKRYRTLINVIGSSLERGRLSYDERKNIDSFQSVPAVLYCMLFNLVKNGARAQYRAKREEPILVSVHRYQGIPTACFRPQGSEEYSDFLEFRVQDVGGGFPEQNSFRSYFEKDAPSAKGHGFGLYFVGLAAKVLRAPIEIISTPGNTSVSVYHPIFPA